MMIKKTSLLLIFIALLFFSVPAESADWLNYYEDYSVDMDSIRSTSSNTIMVLKKVEPAGTTAVASIVSEVEVDCANSMIRYIKETTSFKGGRSKSSSKDEKFRKVTVEDDDESLMELVCSLKRSN